MAAGNLALTIEQGTTWNTVLTWKIDGDEVDLTDFSARMQARVRADASATVLALTSDPGGGITLGGVAGTIEIDLSEEETRDLPPGVYVYDLELVDGDDAVTRLVEGVLTVTAEVTR